MLWSYVEAWRDLHLPPFVLVLGPSNCKAFQKGLYERGQGCHICASFGAVAYQGAMRPGEWGRDAQVHDWGYGLGSTGQVSIGMGSTMIVLHAKVCTGALSKARPPSRVLRALAFEPCGR